MGRWKRIRQAASRKIEELVADAKRGREIFLEALDESVAPEIDELDDDQKAVADAIASYGMHNWVKIHVISSFAEDRDSLLFIRLNRNAPRTFGPFGALESCAVELVVEYDDCVAQQDYRNTVSDHVDKYIQIRLRDLYAYLDQNSSQERLYVMGAIPTPMKAASDRAVLDGSDGYMMSAAVFPTKSRRWWMDVITSNVPTEDYGGANVIRQVQVAQNHNPAYQAATTSTSSGDFHESPIYEEPTHTF